MVEPIDINIRKLFEQYKDKVYRLGLAVTKNRADAEDVSQEAFLKIIKNLPRFRGASSLSTWIYKITLNEARMKLRSQKRESLKRIDVIGNKGDEPYNIFELIGDERNMPDKQAMGREFEGRIETVLNKMPIKYRIVLLLREVEGLSGKRAADILGIKPSSVKTRLFRAHRFLNDGIQRYLEDREETHARLPAPPKKCALYINFLYDYIVGLRPSSETAKFGRHISDCPSCKDFLNSYRQALRISRALQCQDLPEPLRAKIESFLM